jgi:hypothetical protein
MKILKTSSKPRLVFLSSIFLSVCMLTGCAGTVKENSQIRETADEVKGKSGVEDFESPSANLPEAQRINLMKSYTADRDFDVLATPNDGGKFVINVENGTRFYAVIRRDQDNWTYIRFDNGNEGYTWSYPFNENESR